MEHKQGFRITDGKGFGITFANGYTVSVQFGAGNYCENRDADFDKQEKTGAQGSVNAETAVIDNKGNFIELPWNTGDKVQGWQSPEDVLRTINWAAAQTKGA